MKREVKRERVGILFTATKVEIVKSYIKKLILLAILLFLYFKFDKKIFLIGSVLSIITMIFAHIQFNIARNFLYTLVLKIYRSFQSDLNLPFISESLDSKEALRTVNSYLSILRPRIEDGKAPLILKNQNPSLTDRTVIRIIDMLNSSSNDYRLTPDCYFTYNHCDGGEVRLNVYMDKEKYKEHIYDYENKIKIYNILTNKLYMSNISLSDISLRSSSYSGIERVVVLDALMNNNLTETTKKELEEAMSALFERDMTVTTDKLNIVVQ